jgi:nitrous oxide reductase
VHDWLRESQRRWLIVLDKVDDPRFLVNALAAGSINATKPMHAYSPNSKQGSILVTSRDKTAAMTLVKRRNIVTVEPMDKSQAQALFENKLGKEQDYDDVARLAAALEYMPLAMAQAAAYILQMAPRYSVKKYLREFKKSEAKRASLLDHDEGQLRRDLEAKNPILITWQISFEYIQEIRPSAADLLDEFF